MTHSLLRLLLCSDSANATKRRSLRPLAPSKATLVLFEQVTASVSPLGLRVMPLTESLLGDAVRISKQHELLVGDALVVAVMQANGLTNLASSDADFDRVPGITRFAPV